MRLKEVIPITRGPKSHFFGYYGISTWDYAGRRMLCLESDFDGRLPTDGETARICIVDAETLALRYVSETRAWNFQQGAMLHWLGPEQTDWIVYNDRIEGKLRGIVLNVETGERRAIERPVSALSPDGKLAASFNYDRLTVTRPVTGYAGGDEAFIEEAHPAHDGLYLVNVVDGSSRLLISIDAIYKASEMPEDYDEQPLWLNHALINRRGDRVFFLLRYNYEGQRFRTGAYTVGVDGKNLRCIIPYAWGSSHFDWLDGEQMVVTTRPDGKTWRHMLLTDGAELSSYVQLGEMDWDGHCHVSADGQWLVTDSYPRGEAREESLYVMRLDTTNPAGIVPTELGKYPQPVQFSGDWRCDLHPRWRRDGKAICFDSTHSGTRQMYAAELEA